MFFIEAICKYLKKDRFTEIINEHDEQESKNPLESIPIEDESADCEHIFMPVDSTGEILACTKCGELKHKKDLKDQNFFRIKNP